MVAVVAGYAALLALKHGMARWDLAQDHSQRVQSVLNALQQASAAPPHRLPLLLRARGASTGLDLRLMAEPARSRPPFQQRVADRTYYVTITPLRLADGSTRLLQVRQDVTARLARERMLELLLVAAAGISVLSTSSLLRLALNRGLTQPLTVFSQQLSAIRLPPVGHEPLVVSEQPEELHPIARSFNALLSYIEWSWTQQRSFVDGVAHELRTPITLISGYSQSLRRRLEALGPEGGELAPLVDRLGQEAHRLGVLVDELLTLARSDAGHLMLDLQTLDLDEALVEAYERMLPLSGGRLRLKPPLSDDPAWVWGDPERLQQCLSNLVVNALRYSPVTTSIELFTSTTADAVVAHVRDHGPGVPATERQRIFDRFVRGSGSSEASGSGLGLPLVRMLMQAMGGDVLLADPPGGGAEFQLRLPRHKPDLSPPPLRA